MQLLRRIPQVVLGAALAYAGIGHLTTNRTEFQAQVPTILKSIADFVVLASGVVEIVLGLSLIFLWRYRGKLEIDSTITDLASFAIGQGINYKILKIHNPWLRDKKLLNLSKKKYFLEIPTEGY